MAKDKTYEDMYKETLGEVPWRTRGGLVGEARRNITSHASEAVLAAADKAAMAIDRAEKYAGRKLRKLVRR